MARIIFPEGPCVKRVAIFGAVWADRFREGRILGDDTLNDVAFPEGHVPSNRFSGYVWSLSLVLVPALSEILSMNRRRWQANVNPVVRFPPNILTLGRTNERGRLGSVLAENDWSEWSGRWSRCPL